MDPNSLLTPALAEQAEADQFNQQGNASMVEGRFQEAIEVYRQALECHPGMARAMSNMGVAYTQLGDMDQALEWFRQAFDADPSQLASLQNLVRALRAAGRHKELVAPAFKFMQENPTEIGVIHDIAELFLHSLLYTEAAEVYERLVRDNPDNPDLWNFLAASLHGLAYDDRAIECIDQAEALKRQQTGDTDPAYVANRVFILARHSKNEALEIAEEGLRQFPEDSNIMAAYGEALACAGRLEEAASVYERCAIEGSRQVHPAISLSYAGTLFLLNYRDRALEMYEKLKDDHPDFGPVRFNFANSLLAVGRYREGWEEFEHRFITLHEQDINRHPAKPVWKGEAPAVLNGPLLVISEQGQGDTLQFVRYIPLLVEQGYDVIFEVWPHVKRLFEESMPYSNLRIIPRIDEPGRIYQDMPFAAYVSLMSLPHRFGTTLDTIPDKPYLMADPLRKAHWRKRLFDSDSRSITHKAADLTVGLVWAGDARPEDPRCNLIDRRRSTSLQQYDNLKNIPGVTWVSLQKGPPSEQITGSWAEGRILDFMDEVADFADTAAIIANLDLVISVDTSVVHLAGGMGVPVWVLSRFDGCWRWLLDRDDSPWYPSARLFRQKKPGDWAAVIEEVGAALRELVESRKGVEG